MSKLRVPKKVRVFEVGPRDGLQNEKHPISLDQKVAYIERLIAAGAKDLEIGAFVRPDRIPQMADTDELCRRLRQKGYFAKNGLNLWALVPNEKGLERAVAAGVKCIAVFGGATDTFTQKNIGMTMKESLDVARLVTKRALSLRMRVRGYVSVCWGCPYEEKVRPAAVLKYAKTLLSYGVEQISLGDTIGVGTPVKVTQLLAPLAAEIEKDKIAVHFHDTRGTALANCLIALQAGVTTFDSASGGLGGCNYAPGASGNVATEDLVYMFEGMGVKTGFKLDALSVASRDVLTTLNHPPASKYVQAWLASKA